MVGLVTHLYQQHPTLRERVSFDDASSAVLRILADHAGDCFEFSFFSEIESPQKLVEALKPGGLDALSRAIVDWAAVTMPVLGVIRLAGWTPEAAIVSGARFWIRPSPTLPASFLADYPFVRQRQLRFDCFPPDRERPMSDKTDSLMGTVAEGEQAVRSEMRAMAGALCLSLEPGQPWLITGGEVDSLLVLIYGSRSEWMSWEMPVPALGRHTQLSGLALATMKALVVGQLNRGMGHRLRLALESVGSAWRKGPKDRFLDHYAALDGWFDRGGRQKDVIAGVRAKCGEDDSERIGRLTGLRDELAHGRTNTVEQAPSYLAYRRVFRRDPARDLFRIVQTILTRAVAD